MNKKEELEDKIKSLQKELTIIEKEELLPPIPKDLIKQLVKEYKALQNQDKIKINLNIDLEFYTNWDGICSEFNDDFDPVFDYEEPHIENFSEDHPFEESDQLDEVVEAIAKQMKHSKVLTIKNNDIKKFMDKVKNLHKKYGDKFYDALNRALDF